MWVQKYRLEDDVIRHASSFQALVSHADGPPAIPLHPKSWQARACDRIAPKKARAVTCSSGATWCGEMG